MKIISSYWSIRIKAFLNALKKKPQDNECPLLSEKHEKRRSLDVVNLVNDPSHTVKHLLPITNLVGEIMEVPICTVSFLFKSIAYTAAGLPEEMEIFRKVPRRKSFCGWSVIPLLHEPLIVDDTLEDARFRNNVYVVSPPNLRYYVGIPIVLPNDERLGNLCIMDTKPRKTSAISVAALCNVSLMIMDNLIFNRRRFQEDFVPKLQLICNIKTFKVIYPNLALQNSLYTINKDDLLFDHFQLAYGDMKLDEFIESKENFEILCRSNEQWKSATLKFSHCANTTAFSHIIDCRYTETYPEILNNLYFVEIVPLFPSFMNQIILPTCPPDDSGLEYLTLIGKGENSIVHVAKYKGELVVTRVCHHVSSVEMNQITEKILTITHPHLVKIHKYIRRTNQYGEFIWTLMEYCNNGTLVSQIEKGLFRNHRSFFSDTINMENVLKYALQIAQGMKLLHDNDIVHRSLLSSNILFCEDVIKLSGYGMNSYKIGKRNKQDLICMPPEFLNGTIPPDKCTDIYSYGVILYEIYTSQRPWAGMTYDELKIAKLDGVRLKFPSNTSKASKHFISLAEECLDHNRSARPSFDLIIDRIKSIMNTRIHNNEKNDVYEPRLLH